MPLSLHSITHSTGEDDGFLTDILNQWILLDATEIKLSFWKGVNVFPVISSKVSAELGALNTEIWEVIFWETLLTETAFCPKMENGISSRNKILIIWFDYKQVVKNTIDLTCNLCM